MQKVPARFDSENSVQGKAAASFHSEDVSPKTTPEFVNHTQKKQPVTDDLEDYDFIPTTGLEDYDFIPTTAVKKENLNPQPVTPTKASPQSSTEFADTKIKDRIDSRTFMQVKNNLQIMSDSFKILETTLNIQVFDSRYELCMEKAKLLLSTYDAGNTYLDKLGIKQACESIINVEHDLRLKALNRICTNRINSAMSLKTRSGKLNRLSSLINELQSSKSFKDLDEYSVYLDKLQTITDSIEKVQTLIKSPESQISNTIAKTVNKPDEVSSSTDESAIDPVAQPDADAPIEPTYIHSGNTVYRANGMEISEEEIPYLIEMGYREQKLKNELYEKNARNLFCDNNFSEEESIFFNKLDEEFSAAGLKPNLIKATKLSSGTFNVEYIPQGYLGKVQISETPESFRVIKQGNKRATRIFTNLNEAEKFISGKSGYSIEHTEKTRTYYMQYFIGQNIHNDYLSDLQGLISLIPRWTKYVKYMKRN